MSGAPRYMDEVCSKHYGEEDWIDWLLGRKRGAERDAMAGHLARCARCRETRETWEPLLAGAGSAEDRHAGLPAAHEAPLSSGSTASDGTIAAGGAAERGLALPSEALHRRLRLYVRLRSAGLRFRRALNAHRRTVAAAAAIAVLLLCATGLYRSTQSPAEQRKVDAAVLEPTAAPFLQDPQTASFKVHPELEELGEGYIWFNDRSGEVYVMLEGLLPSDGHDVQVWAVNEHEHVNLGLLHHDRFSRAHLFVKKELLLQAQHIALTVEPAGGSSNPTEPDVLVFRLRRG